MAIGEDLPRIVVAEIRRGITRALAPTVAGRLLAGYRATVGYPFDLAVRGEANGIIEATCGPWKALCSAESRELLPLIPQIIEFRDLKVLKVYRRSYRGTVLLIHALEQKLILKHSRRERASLQKRLLSLFKDSEALTTLKNTVRLHRMGMREAFRPILAIEKRAYGMIEESVLLYEYVEGKHFPKSDTQALLLVVEALKKCHRAGSLHTDAKLENFLLTASGIVMIDSSFKRNLLGRFGELNNFVVLERTVPAIRQFTDYGRRSLAYRIVRGYQAVKTNRVVRGFNRFLRARRARRYDSAAHLPEETPDSGTAD